MVSNYSFCSTCGAANQPSTVLCYACGRPLRASGSPPFYPTHPSASSSQTGLVASGLLLKQHYRILGRLGRGGFGTVYKAEDVQFGNRLVAVKEMSQSGLNSPQEIAETARAFEREALMLAGLRHQNLPRIYDHFSENGRWYVVMDFIEGESLEQYLDKRGSRFTVQETLQIGIQLCTVLDYLHTYQPPIIFRDLKPSNIMLTRDGHVYLIDFGIARHFKPGQTKDTTAFGSPGYAAPEQYGSSHTTPRSDIYSLGVVLYQMLTGINPSNHPLSFTPLQLPEPPALAQLSNLNMQMLSMDAYSRPPSMVFIKEQLQQIMAQITGQAPYLAPLIGGEPYSSPINSINRSQPLSAPLTYQVERTQIAPPTYPIDERQFITPPPRRRNKGFIVIMTALLAVIVVGAVILVALLKPPVQSTLQTAANNPPATATLAQTATTPASTGTSTPIPTTAPKPTPTPAIVPGQILCQADWSQGMDGWSGSADWKVYSGQLLNDGSNSNSDTLNPTIIAPCNIGTGDYAVEVRVKMLGMSDSANQGLFGIEARGDNASDYYQAYLVDQGVNGGYARITKSSNTYDLVSASWSNDTAWHTYRFELQGTTLRLFIDSAMIVQTQDYSFLTGWQVSMSDSSEKLAISSFKVIAL